MVQLLDAGFRFQQFSRERDRQGCPGRVAPDYTPTHFLLRYYNMFYYFQTVRHFSLRGFRPSFEAEQCWEDLCMCLCVYFLTVRQSMQIMHDQATEGRTLRSASRDDRHWLNLIPRPEKAKRVRFTLGTGAVRVCNPNRPEKLSCLSRGST